jgi:hypothetical protein
MKRMLLICALSIYSISYAAEKAPVEKSVLPQKFPTTLKSKFKPDETDIIALRYDWYQEASGDYIGFLKVEYWDNGLLVSKVS